MSAVFTGNGLGLFNTSLSQLGYGGGAGVGQGRDAQYVNVATGNLVWQGSDEHLVFRGLSVNLGRTYNSLGQLADSGADGWITGFERRVVLQSGMLNAAGSVMRRHTGDGAYQDFTYVGANTYQATGGDGAHDTLSWSGTDWRYVEGSTRREEGYASHADGVQQGRLTYLRELRSDGTTPTTWLVDYDANQRIQQIRSQDGTSSGDALVFGYDGAGRLSAIATRENGVLRSQVWYEYDGQGRLTGVVTDLTPDVVTSIDDPRTGANQWNTTASANNGQLFRTQYSYEGTSLRLASVTQSDGTLVSFTYHADGRLKTITRGDSNINDADGVGQTLTYTYGTGTTTVADSLGRSWVYAFDAAGQLTSLTAPAISGQSDVTSYQYDAAGNVTQVKTVRGASVLSQVDYAHDAAGNVTWEWDAAGNAISRTWSASNQLLSLTQYTGVDPDRTGASLPTGGLTTRYIYDVQDRLRFVVDALGHVSEFGYATSGNGVGQQDSLRQYLGASYSGTYDLAGLQAWATATQKATSTLSELSYDAWGRLSQRTDYATVNASGVGVLEAGTAISRYTYDAQGLLRQQSTVRGSSRTLTGIALAGSQQVVYAYDGMGRLMSTTVRQVGSTDTDLTTIHTSYAYLDSGQQIIITSDAGMIRTETRNAAGRLLSVSEVGNAGSGTQTRTSLNYYDSAGQLRASEDAAGGRTYFFYDAKGRLEATVDATGAVSRTYYDGADRVIGTRQYASRLTTTSWLVSGQVVPTQLDSLGIVVSNTTDRVTETTYDSAGRIATVTDGIASSAARSISTYTYDGADRLLQVRTTDSVNTTVTARVVRYFYDDADRQIGVLDAAGYLSEVQYDRAGRVQTQTRYARGSPVSQRASGTMAQLRPFVSPHDQTTRYYYDGRGNQTGVLDAEGYLTEWIFDEAGNARAERRHGSAVTWASNDTLASLRSRAGTYREKRMAYNALGQVETQTNAEGTVTRYTYDEAGRLVKTEVAQGTSDVREGHLRYNAFNELIGELSGEGALQVLPGMSEAQLDAVYAQHGVRHGYDVLGRRIESIDAAGNRTWYFYDAAGRPSFIVRGVADSGNVANAQGEVTETRYNAFGQASETITYTGRITLATPGSRASAQTAISVLSYVSATDTRRQYTYTTRGQLASLIDAEASTTQYSYDAFGQLSEQIIASGTAAAQTTQYAYDKRGFQLRVNEGVGTALERERFTIYDGFGRLTRIVDAAGSTRNLTYDRLGRQLTISQTVSGRIEATATAYDAYSRVVSQTDALGRLTTYAHDDAARSLTVTSPEGVVVSTLHNRHGQTITVSNTLAQATTYAYNRNGQLIQTTDNVSQVSTQEYDTRGLLIATVDGSGRRVAFTYDAVGRVLRRIEDPAGTPLVTQYQYDGQGRQLVVTDPSGRVVQYAYDREGRLKEVVQDPAGVNVQTRYAYDAAGQQISLIEGGGSAARVTSYTYDVLGRRISEVVDPGAGKLNLTTGYAYDTNDNMIRRTDANGTVTRYYYDEADRQIYQIDPLGAMTRTWYDAAGRVVATRQFVQLTNAATLTDSLTIAQVDARLSWGATDQSHYRVYDRDGRLRYTGNLHGQIAEHYYDAAGRQIGTRAFAAIFVPDATLEQELLQGTLHAGDLDASYLRDDARDQRTYQVLDAIGRVRYIVDGLGNTQEHIYDAASRVVGTVRYAAPVTVDATLKTRLEAGTTLLADIRTRLVNTTSDQVQYRVHDAAGRLRYTIDAIGAVRESLFDAAGNVVGERAYATPITVDATLRGKLQAGTATVAELGGLLAAGANDARNLEQFQVRDAAGRVRFTVAVLRDAAGTGTGLITEFKYDTAGRLIERIERETPISAATLETQLPALRAGTASIATLAGFMNAVLRTAAFIYDAAGRVRYTLQAVDVASTWAVREQRYDAVGQVVAEVAYAMTIPSTTTRTEVGVAAAVSSAGGDAASQQRLTRNVYDGNGQLRFRMDDAGAVSELRYDGLGRVVESRQYAQLVSTGTAATETAMATAVNGQANVRITQTAYNAAGQVVSVTDAAGKTESYGYDGLGQRIQLTNKLGHVWTYAYDAAGRMVEQTSPAVTVATASITGTVSTSARTIKTVITYDALGNVLSRTEDATGTQPRTTQYQYDNRGHQIKTIFPDAWQIGTASGAFEATGTAPTIEVTYDALGRAVVQKDVRGYYSYKVYDTLGRIAHEVDADGYVTAYGYNAFGEQTTLRRHATKLNTASIAGFTAGSALSLSQMTGSAVVADAANDRVLTTTYDRRGLKTQVTQSAITYVRTTGATASASPTTQFSYNAFGELTRTSVLLDQAGGLWAHSWQYYDELGRATLSVDAEGYVTTTQYNALGEVTLVHEHARALTVAAQAALTTTAPPAPPAGGDAAIGYDRIVSYTYDAMGRKASETALRHYGRADGSQGVRNVSTQWTYDAAGQAIITDLDGQHTRTSYDALGRVSGVQEAAQERLANTAESQLLGTTNIGLGTQGLYVQVSAYTAMAYDAFGNAVQVTRYANGLQSGQSTPVADAANDQVSVTMYDRQGRAVMSRDAQGQRVFLQYDAADHVVHSWYALSGNDGRDTSVHSYYTYDGAGRQLTARTFRSSASAPDQREAVRYNAFGEIIAKGDDDAPGATLQAQYQYDQAGNLVRSNAEGGAWRDYGYNLGGHQVRESHSVYMGAGNVVTAVTRQITDRLGRTVQMVLPSHTDVVTDANYLSQRVDRWGNVLELVDPRGYQTTYQYNDRNQLVKQIQPLVKVVTTNAAGSWQRPELSWSYDELGRLVASRDGNGNLTRYEYDGTGKQTKVIDANGSVTLTAYDALGRARIAQNALGYLTFKDYDRLDRVTAHGDYLPAASGSTRTRKVLESYVLNQNGQRLQSTNAMGQTYTYDYDSRGSLIRSQTPMNVVMEYAYDLGGRRSLERYALEHNNVVDRDGETVRTNEQTWDYDYFGRLVDRNDLSGRDYNYSYDATSGQLTTETNSSGLNRTTTYYANGLVKQIQETGATAATYTYAYDQSGNRILEQAQVTDSRGKAFNLRTQIVYDSHNRLQRVVQDDLTTGQRAFELTYDYDAAGNRTHVVARSGYGENTIPITAVDGAPEVIGLPPSRAVRTGVATEFRVRLTDLFRDPEGKLLTVTAQQGSGAALPAWLSYSVDANTGEAVFVASTASTAGTYQVRLTANDGTSTAAVTFELKVGANTAPSVRSGAPTAYTIKTNRPWAMEFAVNDYFLDQDVGDSLSITGAITGASGIGIDPQSDASALRLISTAPVAGTYTLTLTATDQTGATRTHTVTLTVAANTAPTVVIPIPNQSATLGRSFLLERELGTVFQDTHGDALTVTASLSNGLPLPGWLAFTRVDQATPALRFAGQVPAGVPEGTAYTVRLTATDPDGASVAIDFVITVYANRAPAIVTVPPVQSVRANMPYSAVFPVASLFQDPDGEPVSLRLVHPEGTATAWLSLDYDTDTGNITLEGTPAAAHAGAHSVQIEARDTEGLTTLLTLSFQINTDTAPTRNAAVALVDRNLSIGRSFSFTLPDHLFADADGDAYSLSVKVIVETSYIEGEGGGRQYELHYSALPGWMTFNPATRTFSGTVPADTAVSSFDIRVSAHDGRYPSSGGSRLGVAGNTGDSDFRISLVPFANSAPVYSSGSLPAATAVHGGTFSYNLPAGAFTEPDGDAMTYTAQVQVGSSWVSLSTLGLSINSTTGQFTGTATNLTQASYNVRIIASDPQGLQGTGTFTLTVTNTPPTASTIPPQSLGRNTSWNFATASFFSDVNQNALTYSASGLPNGLAINATTGAITGSTAVALGNYSVTVTANDGRGGSVSTSFTLTIANSAPVAPSIQNQTAVAGTAWSFLVPSFTDPNGDTLTYSVSGLPAWMSFNPQTQTLSGTPGAVGSWTITVTATDTAGISASQSFTVTTPNVAPALNIGISNQSFGRNQAWWLPLPANTFTDVNGDALTYSATGMPPGVGFDPPNRTFYGTPTALGNYTITVSVSDGRGGTQSTSFTLSIINNPPTYSGNLPNRVAQQNGSINWPLTAGAFLDANSDALNYTLYVERPAYEWTDYTTNPHEPIDRSVPAAWLSASSAGLTIDPNTGTITGTANGIPLPNAGRSAFAYRIKIVASDGSSSVDGIFNLSINAAPVAPAQVPIAARQGRALSATLMSFSDPNGNPLIYSLSGLPAGLSFNPSNRVISGTPTSYGDFNVTYTADDGQGGVTSTTFLLRVTANNIPVAPGIAAQTATTGAAWGLNLPMFSDADNDLMTYSATGLPPGLSFDPATRNITGTPTTAGTYTVTYYANDGIGGIGSTTFTITVNSPPPANVAPVVAIPIPDRYVDYHVNWSYTVPANTFSDANGDTLTYSASGMPSGMTFNATTRTFAMYTPRTGTGMNYTLTVTVSDGRGGFASDQFVLVVYAWEPGGGGNNRLAAQSFIAGSPSSLEAPAAIQAQSTSTAAVNEVQSWYAYDRLNRVSVVNGVVDGQGKVVTAESNKSYGVTYDAIGNEVGRYEWTLVNNVWKTTLRQQTYSLRGELLLTFSEQAVDGTGPAPRVVERRSYDDAGRLLQRLEYYGPGTSYTWVAQGGDLTKTFVSGWLRYAEINTYDNDGRLLTQDNKARSAGTITRSTNGGEGHAYTFPQWLQHAFNNPNISQSTDLGVLVTTSAISYVEGEKTGYDAAGRVRGYMYAEAGKFTHTYHHERYEGWDSYRESFIKGSSDNELYRLTTSEIKYDAAGRQKEIQEHTEYGNTHDRIRTFTSNGDGMILTRRDGTLNGSTFEQKDAQGNDATGNALGRMNLRNVYANGQQVAGLDEEGKLDVLSRLTGFSNTTAGKTQVVVQAGDSLRTVAQRVYGNGNLWYLIAEANGLSGDPASELVAGTSLTVPETKTSSNDSSTFKPYNPGEITGPTSPSLPYIEPPSGHNCTALVRVLSTVVAIVVRAVVTYFTGNEQLGAMAGAAAGAHSGQVFQLMADGEYDWGRFMRMQMNPAGGNTFDYFDPLGSGAAGKIDYKAIAVAAAAAGATSYIGKIDSEYTPVLQAATSHAANYQFSKWAGYDVSWNNRQFVTDVASAYIATRRFGGSDPSIMKDSSSSTVQPATVGPIPFSWKQTAMQVLRDAGSNLMRTAIQYSAGKATGAGSHWNWRNTAADAFGNALGNAFATPYMRKFEAAEQARRDATITASAPQVGSASEWPSAVGGYWPGTNSSWALGGFSQQSASDLAAAPSVVGSISSRYNADYSVSNAVTLDTIEVVGDRSTGRTVSSNFTEWQWRQDYNRWAGVGGNGIPVGASVEQSRAIYHETQLTWHQKNNAEAYASAMQSPKMPSQVGYQLGEGEKLFVRVGGGIVGVIKSFVYDPLVGTLALGRDTILASPQIAALAYATGYDDSSAAAEARMEQRISGAWKFASEDGRFKKIVDSFSGRFTEADALDANGDGMSLFRAAVMRSSAVADAGSIAVGGYGAAKQGVSVAVRGVEGVTEFVDDVGRRGDVRDIDLGAAQGGATGLVANSGRAVNSSPAHNAYQYELLKRDLLRQEIANPGDLMSGPVVLRNPVAGASPAQVQQIRQYADVSNLSIAEGYMSPTGRVSTTGALRNAASYAADAERAAARAAGRPYTGVVGHGPDTTWTGRPVSPFWLDMDNSINSSLGRQAQNYPLGYKPTHFIYERDINWTGNGNW
ncbi:putative Ig domain-containing protein [Pseudoxanthomonas sp. PXM03]|uniref:putative Ig domain-containing protein n=1 Tax=Pseudoxanthomonas sp. PXM03 TaxID=2769284 RepID=UPI0017835A13|nr:putative Ig domain-containing protein [Pseudoxanthomonas sp. PXM03]MBD9437279.1 putative Ig domain-containing protein [Pseudoxanthomonas sp. PXM03]